MLRWCSFRSVAMLGQSDGQRVWVPQKVHQLGTRWNQTDITNRPSLWMLALSDSWVRWNSWKNKQLKVSTELRRSSFSQLILWIQIKYLFALSEASNRIKLIIHRRMMRGGWGFAVRGWTHLSFCSAEDRITSDLCGWSQKAMPFGWSRTNDPNPPPKQRAARWPPLWLIQTSVAPASAHRESQSLAVRRLSSLKKVRKN